MDRNILLQDMKEAVGTKDPIVYFEKMTAVFTLLFDRLDQLEKDNHQLRTYTALAIQWEPKVASDLISKQIDILRQDKETYFSEISTLKKAYADDVVTQNYADFCQFWINTLGWHPFLEYK